MSWYSAGTLTATKNSKTILGSGTQWVKNIRVGEAIQIGTALYQITNVASDTSLSIDPAFAETSGAGKTYRVIPFQGYVKKLADEAARLLFIVDEQVTGFEEIITQELGNATDKVISQDKVTKELEWAKTVITKTEAEAGTATTRRAWSALRVREAIVAWFNGVSGTIGRTILGRNTATQVRGDLGLGTAATADLTTSAADGTSGRVLKVGDGGWMGLAPAQGDPYGYPTDREDVTNLTRVIRSQNTDNGISRYASGIHFSSNDSWGRLRVDRDNPNAWIQGGISVLGKGWTSPVVLSGNLQSTTGQSTNFPMTQKAVTDAINGVSDRRDKLDITSSGVGLDLIEKLEPVSFRLNKRDWYRNQAATSVETHTDEDGTQTEEEKINPDVISKPLTDYDDNDGSLARDDKYTGLIAQDVKAALEDLGLGDLAIIKNYSDEYEGGDDRHYIEYNGLIPVMINAIKELSARVKELEDRD